MWPRFAFRDEPFDVIVDVVATCTEVMSLRSGPNAKRQPPKPVAIVAFAALTSGECDGYPLLCLDMSPMIMTSRRKGF